MKVPLVKKQLLGGVVRSRYLLGGGWATWGQHGGARRHMEAEDGVVGCL